MLSFVIFTILLIRNAYGQGCGVDSCVNGECAPEGSSLKCICDPNWAGNKCNLPQPEVICGNKTIEIFIDKRIVTEQGLPGSAEFVRFMKAPGCKAVEVDGGFYLKVDAPFNECGVIITHDGDDYTFYQQIVWNRFVDAVERPLVLLDFKCTYQDKYTVSFGEITPYVTTVDVETSYGIFKVDMGLYKNSDFNEDEKFGARPVVQIEEEVCVSTELKNVMPNDLVLTNRQCWASTERDGSGDTHYLIDDKCSDDPTTRIISNGESDFGQFCFQMFKWKDSMEEIYMHCFVNVCNITAFPEYCQCNNDRTKRFARALSDDDGGAQITYGPIYPVTSDQFNNELPDDVISLENDMFYFQGNKDGAKSRSNSDSKTVILIAVGVVLVISLIVLGVVVAVYINCRRKTRDQKTYLRTEGEPVVIPNPTNQGAVLH